MVCLYILFQIPSTSCALQIVIKLTHQPKSYRITKRSKIKTQIKLTSSTNNILNTLACPGPHTGTFAIKFYKKTKPTFQVTLYHILKLFQSPLTEGAPLTAGKGLTAEGYEEIVFQEPTQLMQHLLTSVKPLTNGPWKHETDCECFSTEIPKI